MTRTPEQVLHAAPDGGDVKYLPRSLNGNIDAPNDNDTPNSVYAMDTRVDQLNTISANFPESEMFSYCDDGCSAGCAHTSKSMNEAGDDHLLKPIESVRETIRAVQNAMGLHAGEQWVDRVGQKVYGKGGVYDLTALDTLTENVKTAMHQAFPKVNDTANAAYEGTRNTVKVLRQNLAERVKTHEMNKVTAAMTGVSFIFPPLRIPAAAMELRDVYHEHKGNQLGPDDLNKAFENMEGTTAAQRSALTDWMQALEDWSAGPVNDAGLLAIKTAVEKQRQEDEEDPSTDEPLPGVGSLVGTTDPLPKATTDTPDPNELQKKFDDLFPKMTPDSGMGQSPMGGGSPLGGGAPGGGDSPFSGLPQMGQPTSDPFADTPLDAPADDEDLDDDTEPDDGDDLSEEEAEDMNDETFDEDEDTEDNDEEDQDDKPADELNAAVPVAQTDATVAMDPESKEARTVTLPTGKQIEFPTGHQADMVRKMMEADPNNPKSLYMSASEAGYQLPPQGQDLGEKVPPASMMVGDVLHTSNGDGVYVGQGEVLMEDQQVKPLPEVANFDGENQGIFRLSEPDESGPGLDGPVQTVSETQGSVPASDVQTGTPGAPTDAPVIGETDAAQGMTASTGGGALDPNSAFPN